FVGRLAMVHVRGERRESLGGEPITDVLDVADQTPPLLDHQETRSLDGGGSRQIRVRLAAVRRELDHRSSHAHPPVLAVPVTGTICTVTTRRVSASSTVIA